MAESDTQPEGSHERFRQSMHRLAQVGEQPYDPAAVDEVVDAMLAESNALAAEQPTELELLQAIRDQQARQTELLEEILQALRQRP